MPPRSGQVARTTLLATGGRALMIYHNSNKQLIFERYRDAWRRPADGPARPRGAVRRRSLGVRARKPRLSSPRGLACQPPGQEEDQPPGQEEEEAGGTRPSRCDQSLGRAPAPKASDANWRRSGDDGNETPDVEPRPRAQIGLVALRRSHYPAATAAPAGYRLNHALRAPQPVTIRDDRPENAHAVPSATTPPCPRSRSRARRHARLRQ